MLLTPWLSTVGPVGIRTDRKEIALRAILGRGQTAEVARSQREMEKAANRLPTRGPSWARTSDPLIMSVLFLIFYPIRN